MTKLISFLSIFFRLLTTAKQTTESDWPTPPQKAARLVHKCLFGCLPFFLLPGYKRNTSPDCCHQFLKGRLSSSSSIGQNENIKPTHPLSNILS
jgi:hypothetical protein